MGTTLRVGAFWSRLLLAVVAPGVFLIVSDVAIRIGGFDTDVVRNEHFEIGVPVWLLADENWADIQRERLDGAHGQEPRGVRAEDVEWLQSFEEARYIRYKLKPNISVDANNPFNNIELQKGITFKLSSNSDGFRTKEFELKVPGATRIVSIGDPSTFGWGVDPEYTFQELLEQRFRRGRDDGTEVLNLGISGHDSRHGLAIYEHYAKDLEPDVLIVSYGANDARFVLTATDEVLDQDDTWRGTVRDVLYRFATFRLMRRLILRVYDPIEMVRMRAEAEGESRALVRAVDRDSYEKNLRTIVRGAREAGTRAVLLAVCNEPYYTRMMQYVASTEGVPFLDAKELFGRHIDDLRGHLLYADEVRYYEALYGPEVMSRENSYYVTTDGCHPGRVGHNLIADALFEVVQESGA